MTDHERSSRPVQLLAVVGLLIIAVATLSPLPSQIPAAAATPLWCLVCGDYGGVDVALNILLFVPLALGLRLMGLRGGLVVLVGAVVSLVVELLQLTSIPGRDASLSDLLTNTLGSWMGAALATHRATLLFPAPRMAIRLTGASAMAWLAVQAVTAFLLRPWTPDDDLRGAWARSVTGQHRFAGQVTSALVADQAVPDGSLVDRALADRLGHGAEIQVGLRTGRPAAGWSPVFELLGPRGPVVSVEAVDRNLAFQPGLRSYLLRLRRPALHLPEALSSTPGGAVRVVAGRRGNTLWGVWIDAEKTDTATQVLSASFGWSLFTPTRYAFGREVRLVTAVWIAGWFAVGAYWWGTARRRAPATISGLLLLAALGLGLVPRMFGYSAAHWSEWVGAMGGAAAGFTGSRFAAYFRRRCDSPSINDSC